MSNLIPEARRALVRLKALQAGKREVIRQLDQDIAEAQYHLDNNIKMAVEWEGHGFTTVLRELGMSENSRMRDIEMRMEKYEAEVRGPA